MLRILVPSWRFFEEAGPGIEAMYRVRERGCDEFGPWQELLPREPRRSWSAIVFNPRDNLRMAEQLLVERLVDESGRHAANPAGLEQTISYELVKHLVQNRLGPARERSFQFKARTREPQPIDVLVSKVHREESA